MISVIGILISVIGAEVLPQRLPVPPESAWTSTSSPKSEVLRKVDDVAASFGIRGEYVRQVRIVPDTRDWTKQQIASSNIYSVVCYTRKLPSTLNGGEIWIDRRSGQYWFVSGDQIRRAYAALLEAGFEPDGYLRIVWRKAASLEFDFYPSKKPIEVLHGTLVVELDMATGKVVGTVRRD